MALYKYVYDYEHEFRNYNMAVVVMIDKISAAVVYNNEFLLAICAPIKSFR